MIDNSLEATKIRVWDWPVRIFHWTLAASVFATFMTGESERYSLLHHTLGYTAAGLIAFRLVWGVVGTRYARFQQFVQGPQSVLVYLKSIRQADPQQHVGHNPIGGLAVLLLMGLVVLTAFSGWLIASGDAPGWQEELHELAANSLMLVVGIHLMGVVVSSRVHRENLVIAMVTGLKKGTLDQGIERNWGGIGLMLLSAVVLFVGSQLEVW